MWRQHEESQFDVAAFLVWVEDQHAVIEDLLENPTILKQCITEFAGTKLSDTILTQNAYTAQIHLLRVLGETKSKPLCSACANLSLSILQRREQTNWRLD